MATIPPGKAPKPGLNIYGSVAVNQLTITVEELGASEFDKEHTILYPTGTPEYWTQLPWLSWQVAGYGPMMGPATFFNRSAGFSTVTVCLPFVAGGRLTVADMAIFIFTHSAKWTGLVIDEYPHVKAWHDRLAQRPAFKTRFQAPAPYNFSDEIVSDPERQEFLKMLRKFGGQAMKRATDQWLC
ncbi:glutathione S-transferase [Hypoxylon sp. NC1633]|nr:glutathione S-transferase [Hypoxylon sp. NC1633]